MATTHPNATMIICRRVPSPTSQDVHVLFPSTKEREGGWDSDQASIAGRPGAGCGSFELYIRPRTPLFHWLAA